MKTIKFTAKIEWLAPDDFDERTIVAFRAPKKGERYLSSPSGIVTKCDYDWTDACNAVSWRPIIDDWEWPEWLTAAAVVMLPSGDWAATEHVPGCGSGVWRGTGRASSLCLTSFSPLPCNDWRKSLRINPRLQNGGG